MPLSLEMETHDAADREHAWRHHGVILFAMVMVLLLLVIESRRYRFFDLYRTRVRSLERHYYAQVFSPATEVDPDWTRILSNDLRKPDLLINLGEAFSRPCAAITVGCLSSFYLLGCSRVLHFS